MFGRHHNGGRAPSCTSCAELGLINSFCRLGNTCVWRTAKTRKPLTCKAHLTGWTRKRWSTQLASLPQVSFISKHVSRPCQQLIKREKSSSYLKVCFFPFFSLSTRSRVFPQTGAAWPGRGGCVDSLSLLMEKKHTM